MLRLIVHADDLGLSEPVNEGILEAHLKGIVTSASIMATGRAFAHAVRICEAVPTLDVGIHLTLVEEVPALPRLRVPSLVNGAGRFHPGATAFMGKYLLGEIQLREVRCELEAQVDKVLSHGLRVTHLDSHQHLHMLPQIRRIAADIANKYRIPAMRVPHEPVQAYMLSRKPMFSRLLPLLVLNCFCRAAACQEMCPDHFVGFYYGGRLNKQNLRTLIGCLPSAGTCELMCHPGIEDSASRYSHWAYHWSEELNALTDPEIAEILEKQGVRLISYRELAHL